VSQTHFLKTRSVYWHAIERGDKTFEVRANDRDYQAGDTLILQEWDDHGGKPLTDVALVRDVSYILHGGQFGVEPGYVVMSLEIPHPPQGGRT
jgi:hypothetical protein